jgi:uncharacterized protein YjdB
MKRIFLTLLTATLLFGCFLTAKAEGETQTILVKSLELNRTKAVYTLKQGKNMPVFSLSAKVKPSNATAPQLSFVSSNEAVATVDQNGLVTCVGFGQAIITVSTNDGSQKSQRCTVTVKKTAVTRISLGSGSYTISVGAEEALGKTTKLFAEVAPKDAFDRSLTWVSSDESVASVDDTGLVTSVNYGTAIITASANDGSLKSASCTVRVEKLSINSIDFKNKSETIAADANGALGKKLQLSAAVSPQNAFDTSLVWSSSDESVATVDNNGLVTSVGYGIAVITATSADGGGASGSCSVNVAYVKIKKISLNAARLSVAGGETFLLKATVMPEDATIKAITWQSSDTSVVRVDENGLVTGYGKGEAKVSAVAADGTGVIGICKVKVTSNAKILENGEAKDPVFYGNVYDLYSLLGSDEEQSLRAYYSTLGKDRAARILRKALEYAGVGYAYVDCSKLTKIAYRAGGYTIPRISDDQAYALRSRTVDRSMLRPGDLIFFKKQPNEFCSCGAVCRRYGEIHHVGIYFGFVDGSHYIIDASSVIGKIVIRKWDGSDNFAEMLYAFAIHR